MRAKIVIDFKNAGANKISHSSLAVLCTTEEQAIKLGLMTNGRRNDVIVAEFGWANGRPVFRIPVPRLISHAAAAFFTQYQWSDLIKPEVPPAA